MQNQNQLGQHKEQALELRNVRFAEKNELRQQFLMKRRGNWECHSDYMIRKQRQVDKQTNLGDRLKCLICSQYFIRMINTTCGHSYCELCLFEHLLNKCKQCGTTIKGLQFIHCRNIDNTVQKLVDAVEDASEQANYEHRLQEYQVWADKKQLNKLDVGMELDVLDTEHIWCVGTIREIRHHKVPQILIHYNGWNKIYDEYISYNSPRLSPLGLYTMRKDILLYQQSNNNDAISNYVMNQQLQESGRNQQQGQTSTTSSQLLLRVLYSQLTSAHSYRLSLYTSSGPNDQDQTQDNNGTN